MKQTPKLFLYKKNQSSDLPSPRYVCCVRKKRENASAVFAADVQSAWRPRSDCGAVPDGRWAGVGGDTPHTQK